MSDKDTERLLAAFDNALEKHVLFSDVAHPEHPFHDWFTPNDASLLTSIDIDVDVDVLGMELEPTDVTLEKGGTYFIEKPYMEAGRLPDAPLYVASVTIESLSDLMSLIDDRVEAGLPDISPDDGGAWIKQTGWTPEFSLQAVKAGDGSVVNLRNVVFALAMQDAEDGEGADLYRIFMAVMRQEAEKDERPISITTSLINRVDTTTDRVSKKTWRLWAGLKPGQLAMGFSEDGRGEFDVDLASRKDQKAGIERPMLYGIDFDALNETLGRLGKSIVPKLGPYDKRVYDACASVWRRREGRDVFTLGEIANAMGYRSTNKTTREKVFDSLTKMAMAHIWLDNIAESSAYKYDRFVYDGPLLPMERVTGYVDGNPTDALIHLFREPPLFTFARERGQFTTHKVEVLQAPISMTDTNILIQDYLREEIAWMKKGTRRNPDKSPNHKIAFESVFETANITGRKAKERKRRDIIKLMDHYVSVGWIAGYEEYPAGVEVTLR